MHTVMRLAGATLAMLAALASDASSARDPIVSLPSDQPVAASAPSACVRRSDDPKRPWLGTWTGSDGGAVLTLTIGRGNSVTGTVIGQIVGGGRAYQIAGEIDPRGLIEARIEPWRPSAGFHGNYKLSGLFPFVVVDAAGKSEIELFDGRRFELCSDERTQQSSNISSQFRPATFNATATAQAGCVRRSDDPERPWLGTWTGSDGDGAVLTLRIMEGNGAEGRVRGTLAVAGRTFNVAGGVNAWGEIEARIAQPTRNTPIHHTPTLAGTFPFVAVRNPNVYNSVLDGRRFELCGEVAT